MADDVPPPTERRRFSRIQVIEATAATVLSAAIIGTATGMGWLVISLPNRLQQLEGQISRILGNQERFDQRFNGLEQRVSDHDRRIIKLEVTR